MPPVVMPHIRDKSAHQLRIEEFMQKIGYTIPDRPIKYMRGEDVISRARRITEEYLEAMESLGIVVEMRYRNDGDSLDDKFRWVDTDTHRAGLRVRTMQAPVYQIAHELIDLSIAAIGALSIMGIADEMPCLLIDTANLRKFGPGAHHDPGTRKWIKPDNFVPANLEGTIEAQRQWVASLNTNM